MPPPSGREPQTQPWHIAMLPGGGVHPIGLDPGLSRSGDACAVVGMSHAADMSTVSVSVTRLSLPSVVSAEAANFMPGSKRFPSANLMLVLERDTTVRPTNADARIIENRVPVKGTRWSTPPSGVAIPPLSPTASGIQPRRCHPKRHVLLAREAELGAIAPHPVKHHAYAPGQGNGRALLPRSFDRRCAQAFSQFGPVRCSIAVAAR